MIPKSEKVVFLAQVFGATHVAACELSWRGLFSSLHTY